MRDVVLADFGLAASVLSSISGSSKPSVGTGTLYYMVRVGKAWGRSGIDADAFHLPSVIRSISQWCFG